MIYTFEDGLHTAAAAVVVDRDLSEVRKYHLMVWDLERHPSVHAPFLPSHFRSFFGS